MSTFPFCIKTVLDTNVLYSRILRDFFLYADSYNLIKAHWSERTLAELEDALKTNLPKFDDSAMNRLVFALHQYYPDALIKSEEDIERDITAFGIPDAKDAHVISAAVASESSLICTWNLSDFPAELLKNYDIKPVSPDSLLQYLLANYPKEFEQVYEQIKAENPTYTDDSMVVSLKKAGAVQTALAVSETFGH